MEQKPGAYFRKLAAQKQGNSIAKNRGMARASGKDGEIRM